MDLETFSGIDCRSAACWLLLQDPMTAGLQWLDDVYKDRGTTYKTRRLPTEPVDFLAIIFASSGSQLHLPTSARRPPSDPIPRFYRTFFTTVDPLIALIGLLTPLLAPQTYLHSFSPTAPNPLGTETLLCLDILASCFADTMILQLYLLPARPRDLVVWKAVRAFILVSDFGIGAEYWRALGEQRRLWVGGLRAEEGRQILIVGVLGMIRVGFLVEIGMRGSV